MSSPARLLLGLVACALGSVAGCASIANYYLPRGQLVVAEDVAYASDDHPRHRLDFYAPRDAPGFPTVVFVHGGWWSEQDRRYYQPVVGLYGNVGAALASRGIAVANISYRLHPEAGLDDMLDDVAAAVKFVRNDVGARGGDPDKLVLSGHSAGGHLVALFGAAPDELARRGVDPAWVKGVAALSGIYTMEALFEHAPADKRAEVLVPLFSEDVERQRLASPLHRMGEASLPFLFIVGEADLKQCLADYLATRALAPELGLEAAFIMVPAATHGDIVLDVGSDRDVVTPAVEAFVLEVTAERSQIPAPAASE